MTSQGIDCGAILRTDRYQTPTKVRILGGMPHASRQQIVRYDIEDRFEMTAEEAKAFGNLLREQMAFCHAALVSDRSEEHTSELQSPCNLVCRLLLEKKKTWPSIRPRWTTPRSGVSERAQGSSHAAREV